MRGCNGLRRWRLLVAAALATLVATWCGERRHAALHRQLPQVASARAAHALADFVNHPLLYPNIKAWWVENETGNYTSWRYTTQFRCGARCVGAARVSHAAGHEATPARHGAASEHDLHFTHEYCTRSLLLPLLTFCDEVQTYVRVRGAVLTLAATAHCSLWAGGAACRELPALPSRLDRLLASLG